MNQTSRETLEARAVRLTRAAPLFDSVADQLIISVRRAMGVPDQAEPEVEGEFAALRETFNQQFLPEFSKMYATLLLQQLGSATSVVLRALEGAPAQAYLGVAQQIEADVNTALREYVASIAAALSSTEQS